MWALMMVVCLSSVCCSLKEIKSSFDEIQEEDSRSPFFTRFLTFLCSDFSETKLQSRVVSEAGLWSSLSPITHFLLTVLFGNCQPLY